MSLRNLVIITKIILFYSIFFVGMKLFIILQGAWLIPNIILSLPFLVLAMISGYIVKVESYSWLFVFVGTAIIILMRIYETEWVVWMHDQLNQ